MHLHILIIYDNGMYLDRIYIILCSNTNNIPQWHASTHSNTVQQSIYSMSLILSLFNIEKKYLRENCLFPVPIVIDRAQPSIPLQVIFNKEECRDST